MLLFSKVWASCFCFSRISDFLPDVCGRLRGEGVVKASLRGTHCGFCERIQVSTVPVVSRNRHELQPIITEGCPWTGWKCSIGCLLVHGSDDIGLEVCTGRATPDTRADGLVRCDAITYLTASPNVEIAPGPFTTNV
jgi:hypothetical protein